MPTSRPESTSTALRSAAAAVCRCTILSGPTQDALAAAIGNMSRAVGRRAKLLLYQLVTHTSDGLTDRSKPQAC